MMMVRTTHEDHEGRYGDHDHDDHHRHPGLFVSDGDEWLAAVRFGRGAGQ